MAMITCWECKDEISSNAVHCPKCGAKKKKPRIFLKLFAVFFVVSIATSIINLSLETPEQKAVYRERQIAEDAARQEEQRPRLTAMHAARVLRKLQRNPDSFKVETAVYIKNRQIVCFLYRSQNGCGGMNAGHAIASETEIIADCDPRLTKKWASDCNKSAPDAIDVTRYVD